MLDDFENEQPIVCKILKNSIKKNKYSHAYLFELNGYSKGLDIALAFAKFLLCPHNYSNSAKCDNCYQCQKINDNNFLEIKIIEADGQWIKKEQLEKLQHDFMTKSLVGNKKVYIINGAEKLNVQASNSLLKFLEEPPEGIIAILITNNIYQLLNTIISRCQIISLKKICKKDMKDSSIEKIGKYLFSDLSEYQNFVLELGNTYIDTIIEYLLFLERKKEETIVYRNKEFIDIFNDRKKIAVAFELFVLYYKDVLNKLLNIDYDYFNDYKETINTIVELNNINTISQKIKIIVDLSTKIKYNLNINLLMDKFVILVSEVKHD